MKSINRDVPLASSPPASPKGCPLFLKSSGDRFKGVTTTLGLPHRMCVFIPTRRPRLPFIGSQCGLEVYTKNEKCQVTGRSYHESRGVGNLNMEGGS
jgi:hypothetical protein